MLKEYTINVPGLDNGNVIPSGFKIKVIQITHSNEGGDAILEPSTFIQTCTENESGMCGNDQFPTRKNYPIQSMSSSSNAVLAATIENDLDSIYGEGNWS